MEHKKKNIIELTRITPDAYRAARKLPLRILVDNVRSMHNIGAFFRTADAFLVDEIILAGISGTPPHPEISKSALGAELSVAWRHVPDAYEEALALRSGGWSLVVLEQTHDSVDLRDFDPVDRLPLVLVVGNEVEGVDQRIADIADTVVEIEQCGTKHSLNVSVSAGLAMWKIFTALRTIWC